MKKCAKCGGSMYKTGGSTMKTKLDVPKGKIYGIPQTGGTGPITMKKGGPVKKKLVKAQKGSFVPYGEKIAPSSGTSTFTAAKKGGAIKTKKK